MIVLKVDITVKPGTEAQCREIIRILHEHSRKESGCVQYVGHQSNEDPRHFLFYEVYKDKAALQAHRDAPYYWMAGWAPSWNRAAGNCIAPSTEISNFPSKFCV